MKLSTLSHFCREARSFDALRNMFRYPLSDMPFVADLGSTLNSNLLLPHSVDKGLGQWTVRTGLFSVCDVHPLVVIVTLTAQALNIRHSDVAAKEIGAAVYRELCRSG